MKRIGTNTKVKADDTIYHSLTALDIIDKVDGVVVINNEGIPIKSTMDSTSTVQVYLPPKKIDKLIRTSRSSGLIGAD